jgi:hypothetical protein
MNENEDTVVVFTARSPERIVLEGGSQGWVLNAARAKLCSWVICTQNRHNPDHEFSDATEPHGAGFLLGRISELRRSQEDGGHRRWLIAFSEYARINKPNVWDHGRNPVRYTSLEELGISIDGLKFQPMPQSAEPLAHSEPKPPRAAVQTMTIPEAKNALAAAFGIEPEAVEITIRG